MKLYELERNSKDEYFATSPQSPLTDKQKRDFKGLIYFPVSEELILEVDVKKFSYEEEITMQTSTGGIQTYTRYGEFDFTVEGKAATLVIYAGDFGYFLPFVDSLAGKLTYGAGRYLEPKILANGRFEIDFNDAYNPYCAYNDRWSCPIPPFENRLSVPIKAGEKIFKQQNPDYADRK